MQRDPFEPVRDGPRPLSRAEQIRLVRALMALGLWPTRLSVLDDDLQPQPRVPPAKRPQPAEAPRQPWEPRPPRQRSR